MKSVFLPIALLCLLCVASAPLRADLVTNGGFETGNFTGWTQFGDTSATGVTSDPCPSGLGPNFHCPPHTGTYAAYFGNGSPGGIEQTIVTNPADTYTVDFWVKLFGSGRGSSTPNEFEVAWGGTTLDDIVNVTNVNWEHLTFTGLAASSLSTNLAFTVSDAADWIGIDDVTVTAAPSSVPEPAAISLLAIVIALAEVLRRRRALEH